MAVFHSPSDEDDVVLFDEEDGCEDFENEGRMAFPPGCHDEENGAHVVGFEHDLCAAQRCSDFTFESPVHRNKPFASDEDHMPDNDTGDTPISQGRVRPWKLCVIQLDEHGHLAAGPDADAVRKASVREGAETSAEEETARLMEHGGSEADDGRQENVGDDGTMRCRKETHGYQTEGCGTGSDRQGNVRDVELKSLGEEAARLAEEVCRLRKELCTSTDGSFESRRGGLMVPMCYGHPTLSADSFTLGKSSKSAIKIRYWTVSCALSSLLRLVLEMHGTNACWAMHALCSSVLQF